MNLTCVIMKCLKHIIKRHLFDSFVHQLIKDKLQFAYSQNRSFQDAVLTLFNQTCEHLESKNSQIRILFVDFSSTFNTIQPHVLLKKMLEMKVNSKLILWIYNHLTERLQYTKVKKYQI